MVSQEIWVRSTWKRNSENRGSPFIRKWNNSLKEVHFKRFGKSLQVVPFPEIMIRISGKVVSFVMSFLWIRANRSFQISAQYSFRAKKRNKKTSKETNSLFDTWEFWKFKREILSKWITHNTIINLNRKNRCVPRTHFGIWPWRALC